jgi:hypothetical protein
MRGRHLAGAAFLLSGEAQGLALDFTYADATQQMLVRDTGTPANDGTFNPFNKLTYTTTTPKMLRQSDGIYRFGNHNLCVRSQELDSGWGSGALNTTTTANATTAPDGTSTADKIAATDTTNGNHRTNNSVTLIAGGRYRCAAFLKAAGESWGMVGMSDNTAHSAEQFFDLTNGVVGTGVVVVGTPTIASTRMTDMGSGWYLCEVVIQMPSGSATGGEVRIGYGHADATTGYAGTAGNGIYAWGIQVMRDPVQFTPLLASYIATTSAAKFSLPYEYNASGALEGLQLEAGLSNQITNSQDMTAVSWSNTSSLLSRTANVTTAPDGTVTADKVFDANTNAGDHELFQGITVTASADFTWQVFAKPAERTSLELHSWNGGFTAGSIVTFNLSTGVATPSTFGSALVKNSYMIAEANGWYRCVMVANFPDASTAIGCYLKLGNYTGVTNSGIYLWGADAQAGGGLLSHIPTLGSALARVEDSLTFAKTAFPYSGSLGTLVAEFKLLSLGQSTALDRTPLCFNDASANNMIRLAAVGATALGRVAWTAGGVGQFDDNALSALTANTVTKVGAAFALNDIAACCNGGTPTTHASYAQPVFTQLDFGHRNSGGNLGSMNGYLRKVTYLPRRATNAELQARTS